nr:chitosanase [uncultured Actinoplanes sp.]
MRIEAGSLRTVMAGAGIALVLAVPLAVSVTANADNDVLMSRNRPAAASSAVGEFRPESATDAAADTRWASAPGPGTEWLRIDLGAVRRVERIQLSWATAYAKAYRVQMSSDGSNFTDVYVTGSGNGGTDDLKRLGGNGRFVRVLATQRGSQKGGYSLRDVKAYGPASTLLSTGAAATGALAVGLENGLKKEHALQMVSSAENSTLKWRGEFAYIEDLHDGRGYTGGIVGFCSGTSDMLAVVADYTKRKPNNVLARYLPALRTVDGSDSHAGLDPGFTAAWKAAARDAVFQKVQEDTRDRMYFNPALRLSKSDRLRALGQFAYFDAAVVHGVSGMQGIRAAAMKKARTPAQGGDEVTYLNAFMDARVAQMRREEGHSDTTRIDTAQRVLLKRSNLDLTAPLAWKVYGEPYRIAR